jgi:hypothetical protein
VLSDRARRRISFSVRSHNGSGKPAQVTAGTSTATRRA